MAPADPWPGQDDDTDHDYDRTPSGNIWRPDSAPGAVAAQPALAVNVGSGRGFARLGYSVAALTAVRPGTETGAALASRPTAVAGAPAATALTVTLGLAAASWPVAVWQMSGMDMGVATRLGSFGFFIAVWVVMMAAMMLPGAAPAVVRRVQASGRLRTVPLFVGSYLAVWALVGVAVYTVYRPHGPLSAGAVVIAAGLYELTPVKRRFRYCRDSAGGGWGFGLCCTGSSAGLMGMLVALGVMSLRWMAVITVLACAQKLLPAKAVLDVPLALAIIGLGIWIILAPWSVPGLTPPM